MADRDKQHRLPQVLHRVAEHDKIQEDHQRAHADQQDLGALPARENVSVYFSPLFDLQKGGDSAAMWEACLAAEARLEAAGLRNGRRSGVRRLRLSFCMAENPFGSVVITPDGLLYNCEHCVPGTAHGNVWEGVTDRAALPAEPEEPEEPVSPASPPVREDREPDRPEKEPVREEKTSFRPTEEVRSFFREARAVRAAPKEAAREAEVFRFCSSTDWSRRAPSSSTLTA